MVKFEIINDTGIVAEGTKIIPYPMFSYRKGFSSVVIPDSATDIGKDAFFRCEFL